MTAINQRDRNLLRSTFSKDLKEELDGEYVAKIIGDFLELRGKIVKLQDTDFAGNTGYFKATTERGVTVLSIGLNADGTVNGFEFKETHSRSPSPSGIRCPCPSRSGASGLFIGGGRPKKITPI